MLDKLGTYSLNSTTGLASGTSGVSRRGEAAESGQNRASLSRIDPAVSFESLRDSIAAQTNLTYNASGRLHTTSTVQPMFSGAGTLASQPEYDPASNQSSSNQSASPDAKNDPQNLSADEEVTVRKLQQRDQEVRAHEQAHQAAGGEFAGSPSYSYVRGPDSQQYATGGSVSIDTSPVPGDPEATLEKADRVRKAALAPASPSAQDQQVASTAQQLAMQARMEKAVAAYEHSQGETGMAPTSWRSGISIAV